MMVLDKQAIQLFIMIISFSLIKRLLSATPSHAFVRNSVTFSRHKVKKESISCTTSRQLVTETTQTAITTCRQFSTSKTPLSVSKSASYGFYNDDEYGTGDSDASFDAYDPYNDYDEGMPEQDYGVLSIDEYPQPPDDYDESAYTTTVSMGKLSSTASLNSKRKDARTYKKAPIASKTTSPEYSYIEEDISSLDNQNSQSLVNNAVDKGGTRIKFGKHKGLTYRHVASKFPDYCAWARTLPNPSGLLKDFIQYLGSDHERFDNQQSRSATLQSPETEKTTAAASPAQPPKARIYSAGATEGGPSPVDNNLDELRVLLKRLTQEIYDENGGKEFNLNSPKQVKKFIYGDDATGRSTKKAELDMLDGVEATKAQMILQYRRCKSSIKREESKPNGSPDNVSGIAHINGANEDPLLLLDASHFIYRAYHSMPPLHRADGTPIGAVHGFCSMINRLILDRLIGGQCPHLILVFDSKGKTFRHDLFEEYKANRPETPVDLLPQFDLIRKAALAYGIQQVEAPNYEADDVIATLATMAIQNSLDVNVLSGDKDLMQLVTPEGEIPGIQMIDPKSMTTYTHDGVNKKWGVPPNKVGDVLALAGDASDNVKGVPGIGPKTALKLLGEFGSLDSLLENAENIKQKKTRETMIQHKDQALLSRKLVRLECSIPIDAMVGLPESDGGDLFAKLRMQPFDSERLFRFYDEMGFKKLRQQLEQEMGQQTLFPNDRKSSSLSPSLDTRIEARKKWSGKKKATIPKPEDFADVPF